MQAFLIIPVCQLNCKCLELMCMVSHKSLNLPTESGVIPKWAFWKISIYLSSISFFISLTFLPWFGPNALISIFLKTYFLTSSIFLLTGVRQISSFFPLRACPKQQIKSILLSFSFLAFWQKALICQYVTLRSQSLCRKIFSLKSISTFQFSTSDIVCSQTIFLRCQQFLIVFLCVSFIYLASPIKLYSSLIFIYKFATLESLNSFSTQVFQTQCTITKSIKWLNSASLTSFSLPIKYTSSITFVMSVWSYFYLLLNRTEGFSMEFFMKALNDSVCQQVTFSEVWINFSKLFRHNESGYLIKKTKVEAKRAKQAYSWKVSIFWTTIKDTANLKSLVLKSSDIQTSSSLNRGRTALISYTLPYPTLSSYLLELFARQTLSMEL